jgi:hypothetical protein
MPACVFEGDSDMYGLGIRIGFYLTWLADSLAPWIRRSEVASTRVTITVFIAATFLALVIQTAKDSSRHKPVEVYIILLLCFGEYFAFVPIYAWRFLLRFHPYWDPSRYPRVEVPNDYSLFNWILLTAVSGYQIYFWVHRVPELDDQTCQEFGFLFAKIKLNEKAFQIVNIVFHVLILFVCVAILCIVFSYLGVKHDDDDRNIR